jgi:hypothetical protein
MVCSITSEWRIRTLHFLLGTLDIAASTVEIVPASASSGETEVKARSVL